LVASEAVALAGVREVERVSHGHVSDHQVRVRIGIDRNPIVAVLQRRVALMTTPSLFVSEMPEN
jgi:hypothetical protein